MWLWLMKIPTPYLLMMTIGQSKAIGWLNWCVSGWWRYQLNSSWWYKSSKTFQDFDQILGFWPGFRISNKFQDFDQTSGFNQISGFWLNFRILTKFQNFDQIKSMLWVRYASGKISMNSLITYLNMNLIVWMQNDVNIQNKVRAAQWGWSSTRVKKVSRSVNTSASPNTTLKIRNFNIAKILK